MTRRLLVVADDSFDDADAVTSAIAEIGEVDEAHVVAPIMAGLLDTLTDDEDAHRDAQARAGRVVEQLGGHGIEASGDYSTEDPFDTAVTALRAGGFDGVVVATTHDGHWREEGVIDRLREAVDVPVIEVPVAGGDT